jgi:hypothetical protein
MDGALKVRTRRSGRRFAGSLLVRRRQAALVRNLSERILSQEGTRPAIMEAPIAVTTHSLTLHPGRSLGLGSAPFDS